MVGHVHLDQDVAGEEPLGGHDFLAAAHLDDVLGGNEDLANLALQPVGLHALRERFGHLLLETRVSVNDIPVLAADVGHHAPNRLKIHSLIVPNR